MSGINKVIIVGNLGNDPEMRYTPSGDAICNMSVATSESWTDKNTGQKQEKTEWHRIVIFRRKAEVAGEFLRKGSKVYLEGKLQTRKWQDQAGVEKYSTEIIADKIEFLDPRGAAQPQQEPQQQRDGIVQPQAQSAGSNAQRQAQGTAPADDFSDFDDDIPF
jgi:single-strand DNA-binding protein